MKPLTTEKDQKALILRESYGLTVPERALIKRGLALAETLGKKVYTCPITGAKFVLIPAGTFMMGSPEDQIGRYDNETLHPVTISKPFYLQTTPVTQRQWAVVMGNNPSQYKNHGDDCPVEMVSWNDTQEFIRTLNAQSDKKYYLPTEAQWEYAARAGSYGKYCFGDDESMLGEYAWYCDNSNDVTHPVGLKRPNDWDLYDMHGNVWEWVQDWYGGNYPSSGVTDPEGPASGDQRVLRGACWDSSVRLSRAATRDCVIPVYRDGAGGFRVAASPR